MPREHWRTSELLARGWTPHYLTKLLDMRADLRLDGEPCFTVARVATAEAKSPLLRARMVQHIEPGPGEWLHLVSAVAVENGMSETACKRRLGEPAAYRLRQDKRGFWGGYTTQQITGAGLRVPEKRATSQRGTDRTQTATHLRP